MTMQIEVEGNNIFDDINRDDVNRGNTVYSQENVC